MRRAAWAIGAALAAASGTAAAQPLAPELWDRPRSAAILLDDVRVRGAVRAWLARPGARIVIRHAPGDEAVLQAEELRDWLAALAVDPGHVTLAGGLGRGEPPVLMVEP